MPVRDALELFLLAAIWGASFLFMRVAAPELGPVALIWLRVTTAALCLLPVAVLRTRREEIANRVFPLSVLGVINSAIPFCLLAYATLFLTAGMASILNATSPLWGALVAHLWLKDRLTLPRVLGLVLGFGGVVFLAWGRAAIRPGALLAVPAAMVATLSYGVAASYTKKKLTGVNPLLVAAYSQLAAAVLLAPGALLLWPQHPVSRGTWGAVLGLGIVCTALAYVLYFRLIAHLGPAKAIAVTFLIPPFAFLWGGLFLGEPLTPRTILGAVVILAGTALATGLVRGKRLEDRARFGEAPKRATP